MKATSNAFGFLLRHYRRWARYSVEQAAERAGFSDAGLWSRYETGGREPPRLRRTLQRLAQAVATDATPQSIKFEMLCRSAGYQFLLPGPIKLLVGLPRYLVPEFVPSAAYLQISSGRDRGAMTLVEAVAQGAIQRIREGGFDSDTVLANFDTVVEQVFKVSVRRQLLDDAFSAFLYLETRELLVNPALQGPESRQALAHELAHVLLREGALRQTEIRLGTLLGSDLFESPSAERIVNWLAGAIMLPQPIHGTESIDVSVELVEELAAVHQLPAELVLSRLCFLDIADGRPRLSPKQAGLLARQYPRIVYYW